MTLRLFLSALVQRWYVLVAGLLLGALVALAVAAVLPKRYEAESTVLLTTPTIGAPLDGANYLESRMPTYAEISTSRPVLDEASRTLGLSVPRDVLTRRVAAVVPTSTSLITLTAQWSDPQGAADLSNAVASSFVDLAPRLDDADKPVLRVQVLEPALPPEERAGLPTVLRLAIGSVLGITLALLVALVMSARDRGRGSDETPAAAGWALPDAGHAAAGH